MKWTDSAHISGQGDRNKLFANRIYRWQKLGDIMNSKKVESHTRKSFCRRHWNTLEYNVLYSHLRWRKAKQSKTKLSWNKNTEGFGKGSFHLIGKNEKIRVYLAQANKSLKRTDSSLYSGEIVKKGEELLTWIKNADLIANTIKQSGVFISLEI